MKQVNISERRQRRLLNSALKYSKKNIPVFPLHSPTKNGCSCGESKCKSIGKHPRTENGYKDATTDKGQILQWWRKYPNANIGIPTGEKSGFFVLDVDDGGEGELKKHPDLPYTVESITGSGGRHFFFNNPDDLKITNKTKILKGLDIRGEGGYVVVPPSRHKSGNKYKWGNGESITEYELEDCPDWLLGVIEKGKSNNPVKDNQTVPINKAVLEQQVKYVAEQIKDKGVIIGDDSYNNWRDIGFALANGLEEKGRDYFHTISSVSSKYDQENTDKQYDRCLMSSSTGIKIGTLFHYAGEAGINIHAGLKGKRKFTEHGEAIFEPILEAEIFKEGKYIIFLNEQVLMYHDGYYQAFNDRYYLRLIEEQIKYFLNGRRARAKEILDILKDRHTEMEVQRVNVNTNLINVKNGILDIDTMKRQPHTPDIIFTYQVNANYDKKAKCKKFIKFLKEVLVKEDSIKPDKQLRRIVRRFIGYCFYPRTDFHECLMLYGGGRNGKSVLTFVISELFKGVVSYVHFEDIGEDRFATSDLAGKLVNISSEFGINARLADGQVKGIIAGDEIRAQRKNQPAFAFRPTAKHLITTNNLPRSKDKSLGFFSRFIIIPFHRMFLTEKEINGMDDEMKDRCLARNTFLEQELKDELDGIFLWAVKGLKSLLKKREFPSSKQVTKLKNTFKVHCSSVEMFFDDMVDASDCTRNEQLKVLHKSYIEYCKQYKTPPVTDRRFSTEIKNMGGDVVPGTGGARVVRGVFLKDLG